jgi:drug/metabolite transporter (DMT)-like permease
MALSPRDWGLLVAIGLGPLGAAFFLWDAALKRGDARRIGILSYLTPLASTLLLVAITGRPLTLWVGGAALLIIGAAIAGVRAR